jgi:hypothetical protein
MPNDFTTLLLNEYLNENVPVLNFYGCIIFLENAIEVECDVSVEVAAYIFRVRKLRQQVPPKY